MADSARRPNILLIMADQLSALATSAYGNRDVQTPNIQALADRGVVFQHSYCNFPLCAPSRASLVTGQLCSKIANYDNDCELPASVPTFLHHLRLAGYESLLSGKMHFVGPDQLHGFDRRLTTDIYDADFSTLKSWEHSGDPPRIMPLPDDPESAARYKPGVHGMAMPLKQAGPANWSQQLEYDEEVHYRAMEQLRVFGQRQGTSADRPWFLCVSFTHPHDPPYITEEYWNRYEGVDFARPARPPSGHDPHISDVWTNSYHGIDAIGMTDEDVYRARRGYYAMTSYFDDKVGDLVNEVSRFGMDDDTIVMVTSDHGDMAGEHGMWFKRTVREWSARVPLIVSAPGRFPAGRRVEENVSLVDLYPSILALADVEIPADLPLSIDGHDFTPLLRGEPVSWPNEVIVENYGEGTIRPVRAIVKDRYKYIYVHEQPAQLYDLNRDPDEWWNVAEDPRYADIAELLRARVFDGWDGEQTYQAILDSQRLRMFIKRALETGPRVCWDYQPFFDASKMYSRKRRARG